MSESQNPFDFLGDFAEAFFADLRQQAAEFEGVQTGGDCLKLFENGAPAGFARVRGEDRADERGLQVRGDLSGVNALLSQLRKSRLGRLGEVRFRITGAILQGTDARRVARRG